MFMLINKNEKAYTVMQKAICHFAGCYLSHNKREGCVGFKKIKLKIGTRFISPCIVLGYTVELPKSNMILIDPTKMTTTLFLLNWPL